MHTRRLRGDVEALGYLPVAAALGDQFQHTALPPGESERLRRVGGRGYRPVGGRAPGVRATAEHDPGAGRELFGLGPQRRGAQSYRGG
ncbi:hypothetical protein AN220_04340, partial [Streptomyces nanshensis]